MNEIVFGGYENRKNCFFGKINKNHVKDQLQFQKHKETPPQTTTF